MAALELKEESSNGLILETSSSWRRENLGFAAVLLLIALVVSGVVFVYINQILGWICFSGTVFLALYLIYKNAHRFLATTTIMIDLDSGLATRTETNLWRARSDFELSLDRVSEIVFVWGDAGSGIDPFAEVMLSTIDGSKFMVNWDGRHTEIESLVKKIQGLLHKPIEEEIMPYEIPYAEWTNHR